MKKRFALLPLAVALLGTPAFGQSPGLDKCQKEAANQSAKFVGGVTKAMATCMQKISGKLIGKNLAIADAAKSCAGAFRKLENSVDPTKTIHAKAKAKIRKRCDPTFNASLTHTTAQVLNLSLMPRGIEAKSLDAYCTAFDGDGSLDTVEEWIDCSFNAGLCQARQQLAIEYPRVLEWSDDIQAGISALGADPKYTDALTAVQDLHDALDRFANDQLTINCGPGINSCGNAVVDGTDDCDGVDLGGATCVTIGFRSGTLACGADCHFDVSGCLAGAFPATGQTVSYQAGDDGETELGSPGAPNLTDNGDGTITDSRTGLVWEKKDRSGGVHDRGSTFSWANLNTTFLNTMNNHCSANEATDCTTNGDADCPMGDVCGFAGYRDWRVPNFHELSSIINHGTTSPATYSIFNDACPAACTVLTCSCTQNNPYYTSTTYEPDVSQVWTVDFANGQVVNDPKGTARRTRAVRGGL